MNLNSFSVTASLHEVLNALAFFYLGRADGLAPGGTVPLPDPPGAGLGRLVRRGDPCLDRRFREALHRSLLASGRAGDSIQAQWAAFEAGDEVCRMFTEQVLPVAMARATALEAAG